MVTEQARVLATPYFTARDELDGYGALGPARLGASKLVAAHFRRDRPDLGITIPNERSDTLMAVVNLRPQSGNDIWCEGKPGRRAPMPRGGLAVLDHRLAWSTQMLEPFETVHIFFGANEFERIGEGGRRSRGGTLDCSIDTVREDATMLHLALALLPAIQHPEQVSTLFADHMYEAIRLYLATTYGGISVQEPTFRGGLSTRQKRLVDELILGDLMGDTTLAGLANACGVSVRHFVRAFKVTHGAPPHRWLLEQRVQRAKHLLETTDGRVSDIATCCGFADQSHLTRVFHGMMGMTPAVWRRLRKS
jgi:AraC-like DNA-binding protein